MNTKEFQAIHLKVAEVAAEVTARVFVEYHKTYTEPEFDKLNNRVDRLENQISCRNEPTTDKKRWPQRNFQQMIESRNQICETIDAVMKTPGEWKQMRIFIKYHEENFPALTSKQVYQNEFRSILTSLGSIEFEGNRATRRYRLKPERKLHLALINT